MEELYFLAQVVIAAFLGAVIGFQRERSGKAAGPRTYALVTAGATLFTILSLHGFGPAEGGRIAGNVVVGIGFLGAGLIFHKGNHVENLTTAAGLWTAAAVGLAVGVRFYILAVGVTLIMLLLLAINDKAFKKKTKG
ncbi:MAG: MgtC/SapB family protein [Candidatus Magasanikbacteria bacterium]|nr:MgtC/SapB family protein [Candidatus Magasanikbacteria bacterium]